MRNTQARSSERSPVAMALLRHRRRETAAALITRPKRAATSPGVNDFPSYSHNRSLSLRGSTACSYKPSYKTSAAR